MAEESRKITVPQPSHDEDDLPPPPPPPPPAPTGPTDSGGLSELSNLLMPPPKETFSTFYQQRQKSELKRIFKHIHPDLRPSLDDAVDDEVMRAVQPEGLSVDAAHQGEVQSMKWIFENWALDSIGDPHATKKLLYDEEMKGGDVRSTSSMFEHIDGNQRMSPKRQLSVRGDVRTSTWLFETQPLDTLNRLQGEELVEAVLKEPVQAGDVRGTRQLFESKPLSDVGRSNSREDHSLLRLTSELQEQTGGINKTVKLFQADPRCAIRDNSGSIHEVKSVCREEINSSNISEARWLFQTQPLDLIHKRPGGVKIIRGISLEEGHKGGVDHKRWMFETQPFDAIQEVDKFEGAKAECSEEADVISKRKLFETQPLATLKGDSEERSLEKEEVLRGDVKTSLWLFETQPMETLSDSYEVGRLKKITLSANEQGEVKDKTKIFESCSFQKDTSSKQEVVEKGDVKGFKSLFETLPLSQIAHSEDITRKKEALLSANVKDNQETLETTPLYAIKDGSGNLHEVTSVSREESITGKVQNYKWMFDTKPLDELPDATGSVEVIKGITRQEGETGHVKMAKWLFETQTIDGIHSKFNQRGHSVEAELQQGDVKTCKWLFETQPLDILPDEAEKVKPVDNSSVKSITWLFESQPLDNIGDGGAYNLKLCNTIKDSVRPEAGVQTVKHLFETETLDRIRKDSRSGRGLRCVSQVDFPSGDVSRVKELFESQSLDEIGSEMIATTSEEKNHSGDVEKGSVHTFTWLFENCPMSLINKDKDDAKMQDVRCAESGDVENKTFIFQTSSLDKLPNQPLEEKPSSLNNVDVKSSTMMFETQPLYAIRDKEGQFHEVTTVKKEEVLSGDVRGARWMFETKPLDAIKAENEVYVIRAVTQEDVKRGDVKSARWKFETQPLDSLSVRDEPPAKVVEDIGGSNVQLCKQVFESEQTGNKFVRMVSLTDVQRGDVRTSTWLFENQTIDSLKGEPEEEGEVQRVHRENSQKGDVKRCTWLFESQPLDKIKEPEDTSVQRAEDEIPKVDVKCTTWLFETTPLDKITAGSVADTLSYLCQMSVVHSSGIIIEANEDQNVKMAKYLFESDNGVQIQKEEVVGGNIRNIVFQLLLKTTLKPQIFLLREVEKGKVSTKAVELPAYETVPAIDLKTDERVQNVVKVIDDWLVQDKEGRKGLIMQESACGQAEMLVYALICNEENKSESPMRERGDVKSTIGHLLATARSQRTSAPCRLDENEKGNVNLYKSCIEKGDLLYLKTLQTGDDVDSGCPAEEHMDVVHGDVKEAKRSLCQHREQAERTISDVLPGDVKNTKKVFSSDCCVSVDNCVPREDIIPGNVASAKQQLTVQPPVTVERKDIVAGDIRATMQSLERAKQQSMSVEREAITPGTIYDMDLSAQGSEEDESHKQKEIIIAGDVKAAKKSLELAKQQSLHVERATVVPGKIYNLDVTAQEDCSSEATPSTCSSASTSQPIRTYPKVSDTEKDQDSYVSFETSPLSAVVVSDVAQGSLPSLISCECNGQIPEEGMRGDVKAAVRSLQGAATDTEDVLTGNVQRALQSLEKSRVNVSRGDYKAAMIYRKSGRACPERSRQCVVVSLPPTDTQLSPSLSVTCERHPSVTTRNSSPNPVANGNSKSAITEKIPPPPPPLKTSQKSLKQKPVLSPKPRWTKSALEEQHLPPTSAPQITRPVDDTIKNAAALPQQREHPPTVTPGKMQTGPISTETCCETYKPKCVDESLEDEPPCQAKMSNGAETEIRSVQASLQTSERWEGESLDNGKPVLSMKHGETSETGQTHGANAPPSTTTQHSPDDVQQSEKTMDPVKQRHHLEAGQPEPACTVVLRDKRAKETDDERRQRLSVHKEEIMKGHVEAALEIFDNLRKREQLKGILSQVQEIEKESSTADVSALKTLCHHVPAWMDTPSTDGNHPKTEGTEAETLEDDLESVSSVETAFEDLEKASKEITTLKEQTLAKLLDIEEAIKKALYSISSLKSEADIAGLSGLFHESLKAEQKSQPAKNIRKISIVSSKAKPDPMKETGGTADWDSGPKEEHTKPVLRQPPLSSPSFISIHSAARRPAQQPASTSQPRVEVEDSPQSRHGANRDLGKEPPRSPPADRKLSVLQVKTGPEQPDGMIGTKTVSETYEETDGFGNVFVSSVTSRFFTKQAGRSSPGRFDPDSSPTKYGAMTSQLTPRSDGLSEGNTAEVEGVFVTFSQPKE